MRLALFLALAIAPGCGRIGFEGTVVGDGGSDGALADAPPACATFGPWSTPRRQAALATADEDYEPAIHPGGLAIVYSVKSAGVAELFHATRPDTASDFGAPVKVLAASYEFGPAWSRDGSRLYFTRDEGSGLTAQVATYGGGAFGAPAAAVMPQDAFSIDITSTERELFYTKLVGTSDYNVHHATRPDPQSAWTEDTTLDGFNRIGPSEGWPSFDEVNQTLYLEVDGSQGELAMTTRSGVSAAFGPLTTITELGSGGDPDIAQGGRMIAFGSQRAGGAGGNDIYISTRTCQ